MLEKLSENNFYIKCMNESLCEMQADEYSPCIFTYLRQYENMPPVPEDRPYGETTEDISGSAEDAEQRR